SAIAPKCHPGGGRDPFSTGSDADQWSPAFAASYKAAGGSRKKAAPEGEFRSRTGASRWDRPARRFGGQTCKDEPYIVDGRPELRLPFEKNTTIWRRILTDRPTVLDDLAVIGQAARRHRRDGAAQLGNRLHRFGNGGRRLGRLAHLDQQGHLACARR